MWFLYVCSFFWTTPISLLKAPMGSWGSCTLVHRCRWSISVCLLCLLNGRKLIFEYVSSGWWFGTFSIFPYIGNNHPNWLIFFRGVQTTNQWFLNMFHGLNIESYQMIGSTDIIRHILFREWSLYFPVPSCPVARVSEYAAGSTKKPTYSMGSEGDHRWPKLDVVFSMF